MASLKRAVGRSIESLDTTELEAARRSEIRALQNTPKRMGLLMLHQAVSLQPALFKSLASRSANLRHLDDGVQSTVYRTPDGDSVIKIIKEKFNDPFTPKERRRVAAQLKEEHSSMAAYLGSAVIPHEIGIEQHPVYGEREAVVIHQPFCNMDFLYLGGLNGSAETVASTLREVSSQHPNVIDELATIRDDSLRMADEQGLWTDIVGRNNLGVLDTTGSVKIIDCQPVPPTRPDDQNTVRGRFEVLDTALALAA